MRKRFLALLLSLCMLFSLLPTTALAAEPDPDWDWTTRFNYRIDRADFARMLASVNVDLNTDIEKVTLAFQNGNTQSLGDVNDLYTYTWTWGIQDSRHPSDIASLNIQTDAGTITIKASDLTWVADDSEYVHHIWLKAANADATATMTTTKRTSTKTSTKKSTSP